MDIKDKIDKSKLPVHVAVIMDGNGRWAKKKGNQRIFGHRNGVNAVRQTVEAAAELGIKHLTVFAFSTENWSRPKAEVNALMQLLVSTLNSEIETLNKNNVRLLFVGNEKSLPSKVAQQLQDTIKNTEKNSGLSLSLALSYSGHWEITEAVKTIAKKVKNGELQPEEINEECISKHLQSGNIPFPELLIRTSGEYRISNFLLWQIAYAELYFTPVLWPDFSKKDFFEAIVDFQNRERRFGKTSEQLTESSN